MLFYQRIGDPASVAQQKENAATSTTSTDSETVPQQLQQTSPTPVSTTSSIPSSTATTSSIPTSPRTTDSMNIVKNKDKNEGSNEVDVEIGLDMNIDANTAIDIEVDGNDDGDDHTITDAVRALDVHSYVDTEIYKMIWEENKSFWNDRLLFGKDYHDFLLELIVYYSNKN
eukprot:Awhi_evm1s10901